MVGLIMALPGAIGCKGRRCLNAQFNQLLMETGISSGNELIYVQENQSQTLIYPVIIYSVIIKVSHYRRACSML